jgi:glycosyltransferase involved in cell wall biosynthesis
VIATNVGGAGEIITDGRDGLLLPPRQPDKWAAAIERLMEQPELRHALGRKARQRVIRELSVQAYVKRVVDVYREADGAAARSRISRSTTAVSPRA